MLFLRKNRSFSCKIPEKMFCHFYRPFHTFISYSLHFWIKLNSTKLIWMCPEGQNPSQFTALEIKEYVILMLFSLGNNHFWSFLDNFRICLFSNFVSFWEILSFKIFKNVPRDLKQIWYGTVGVILSVCTQNFIFKDPDDHG